MSRLARRVAALVGVVLAAALLAGQPAVAYEEVKVENGGRVTGTVRVTGTTPPPDKRPVTRDPEACGSEPKTSDAVLRSASGGVKNVVVSLDGVTRGKPFPGGAAELDQRGCWFHPHVLLVRAGQPFTLINSDGVLHNFRTPGSATNPALNKAQPKFKRRLTIQLDHADIIPVNCDVHEWMHAVLVVMAHPYHALTDDSGAFTLADVPPGRYRVTFWHEVLGTQTRDVEITAGGETRAAVEFKGR